MRAAVVDRAAPGGFRLADVPDPEPGPGELLVDVAAFSLNFGEVRDVAAQAADGTVLGWEAAGTVARAAADGSGPPVGTPVVTLGFDGGWARRRAVPSYLAGPVGAGVDLGAAGTVGIAGASALRALGRIGEIRGERVLITGGTGGVGRYAVQLARLAGAHPVVTTRDPDRHGDELRRLGAAEVVSRAAETDGPLRGVLDTVGGPEMADAFDRLGDHGTLVTVGHSSGRDAVFPFGSLIGRLGGHDRSLVTFFLASLWVPGSDLAADLTWLAERVADGTLDPGVSWRGPWTDLADATTALLDRTLHGKAVVDVV